MKRIVISIATIIIIAAVVIGATKAYFSDTETSTGNSFTTGTLDLNLDDTNTNVVKFSLTDIIPGASNTAYWTVKNVGSINGYLDLENKTVVNDDHGCNTPESLVDTTCGAGEGELGANLLVDLFIDDNHDGVLGGTDVSLFSGTLDGLVGATIADISLDAGAEKYISLNWSLPSVTGNIVQSDSSTLGMTFELGQTTVQ